MIPPKVMAHRIVEQFKRYAKKDERDEFLNTTYYATRMALYCVDIIIKNNPMSDPTSSGVTYSMKNYFLDVRSEIRKIMYKDNKRKKHAIKGISSRTLKVCAKFTSPSQDSISYDASPNWENIDSDELC